MLAGLGLAWLAASQVVIAAVETSVDGELKFWLHDLLFFNNLLGVEVRCVTKFSAAGLRRVKVSR